MRLIAAARIRERLSAGQSGSLDILIHSSLDLNSKMFEASLTKIFPSNILTLSFI